MTKAQAAFDMSELDQLFKDAHNLPKIELHTHIGGCYRPQTFLDLAEKKGFDIDHIDFYNVDIPMAFEIFKVGTQLVTECATLKRVTKEIIEDYSKQNTRYLELRSTPKAIGQIESKEQYVATILEAIAEMSSQLPRVKVGYIVSVNRAYDAQLAEEAVDLASKMRETENGRYLVGIELSGDPRKGSFADFRDQFKRAQEIGLKVTLHCAETAD